jgi:SOS-response transcriptional repressor LexA
MNKNKRKPTGKLIPFPGGAYVPRPRIVRPQEDEEGETQVDLNDLLLPKGDDSYILDVCGDNDECEIYDGDKVLVDCSLMAGLRDIVVIESLDNLILTTFRKVKGRAIFGVVTHTLRAHRGWK